MSISTSSYFSNSIQGLPQVAGEYVDIFQVSQYPKYALGTRYDRQDGAIFRYAHFNSNIALGTLCASCLTDASVGYVATNTCYAPSSTYQMPDEPSGVYPGAIGSRYLIIPSSADARTYDGAYFHVVAATGLGQQYRIRASSTTVGAKYVRLSLYDQIQTAVDATSVFAITGCKYACLVAASTTTNGNNNIAGIKVSGNTYSTGSQYGWIQTGGIATALCDATSVTAGSVAQASTATAGYVTRFAFGNTAATGVMPILGHIVSNVFAATQTYTVVNLTMIDA